MKHAYTPVLGFSCATVTEYADQVIYTEQKCAGSQFWNLGSPRPRDLAKAVFLHPHVAEGQREDKSVSSQPAVAFLIDINPLLAVELLIMSHFLTPLL